MPIYFYDDFNAFWQVKVLGVLFMLIVFFSNDRLLLRSDIQTDKLRKYFPDDEGRVGQGLKKSWMWVDVIVNCWATVMTGTATLPLFLASTDLKDIVLDAFGLLFLISLDDYSGQIEFGVETSDFDQIIETEKEDVENREALRGEQDYGGLNAEDYYDRLTAEEYSATNKNEKYPKVDPKTNLFFTPAEKKHRLHKLKIREEANEYDRKNRMVEEVRDGCCGSRYLSKLERANKWRLEQQEPVHKEVEYDDTCGWLKKRCEYGDWVYMAARAVNYWLLCFLVPMYLFLVATPAADGATGKRQFTLSNAMLKNAFWILPIGLGLASIWTLFRAVEFCYRLHLTEDEVLRDHNEPQDIGKRDLLAFVYIVILRRPDPRAVNVDHLD